MIPAYSPLKADPDLAEGWIAPAGMDELLLSIG
jgi:hypothetical protein